MRKFERREQRVSSSAAFMLLLTFSSCFTGQYCLNCYRLLAHSLHPIHSHLLSQATAKPSTLGLSNRGDGKDLLASRSQLCLLVSHLLLSLLSFSFFITFFLLSFRDRALKLALCCSKVLMYLDCVQITEAKLWGVRVLTAEQEAWKQLRDMICHR